MEKDIEFIKKQALSFIKEQFEPNNLRYLDIRDVDTLTTLAIKIEKANLDSKIGQNMEETLNSIKLKYDIQNHNAIYNINNISLPSLDKANFLDIEVIPDGNT